MATSPSNDKDRRRPHGTGGVYYDKSRERWVGSYEAGWTARGTRRRRKVSARTQRGAEAKLREAVRNSQDGDAPVIAGRPTVKSWSDKWLAIRERDIGVETLKADRSLMRKWIVPTIGHRRLEQLSPVDVRAVTSAVTGAGLAASTARRVHATLEKLLKDAQAEGYTVPRATMMVKPPAKGESDRDRIPTQDAVLLLARAVDRGDIARWAAAFLQGMRPAECLGLTWSAIDFDRHQIDLSWQLKPLPYKVKGDRTSGFRVPTGHVAKQVYGAKHLVRPKTEAGRRVIPLVPWMAKAFKQHRATAPANPHGLVWTRPNGLPLNEKDDAAAWLSLQDEAQVAHVDGIKGRRYALYEARHTTATLLRELHVSDETIIKVIGHASILSTKPYLHADETERAREALADVARALQLTSA